MKNKLKILLVMLVSALLIASCSTIMKNENGTDKVESKSETILESRQASKENNGLKVEKETKQETEKETKQETKQETRKESIKENNKKLDKNGHYYSKEDVSLYLHTFGRLPSNYLTKNEAKNLGWDAQRGNLWKVTDKGVIGGDRFGNREGELPKNEKYYEADVNYKGGHRGGERLVYTKGGKVIYYSGDHYENFEVLYE